MNTSINNIPVISGEITVLIDENAETVTRHACKTADAIRKANFGVLLLNCAMSKRRFYKTAEELISQEAINDAPYLYMSTIVQGNLIDERGYVDDMIRGGVKVIIISGWEWTSSSWRRRERLLYQLRVWAEEHDVAIIIYSQARNVPAVGVFDRGGIGRLAMIAYAIESIEFLDRMAEEGAEGGAQLLVDKVMTYEEEVGGEVGGEVCSRKSVVGREGEVGSRKSVVSSREYELAA